MSYPRLIVLFPGIVAQAQSWEQERAMRLQEVRILLWTVAVLFFAVGLFLGWYLS